MRAEPRVVTACWHPESTGGYVEQSNGVMVRHAAGEPAYQVSSGEIVVL